MPERKTNEDGAGRLRRIVIGLAVIYVMTFLAGFLQHTPYNFINYILFSALFAGGIVLIRLTVRSGATGMTKSSLFLTGISTTLLFVFGIAYEWFRIRGDRDLADSLEGLLYWITLMFWVGVAASLILSRRIKARSA